MDLAKAKVKKNLLILLYVANGILVSLGWIMALYSFPRLPQIMPLWLSFSGQPAFSVEKSWLYFLYPFFQTVFVGGFWLLSRNHFLQDWLSKRNLSSLRLHPALEKEFVAVVLIFFNLIFIHIQRGLIFQAYGIEKSINQVYFYSLFGIILLFIPYYRFRQKMGLRGNDSHSSG
ncbi:hypothetical protein KGY73_03705 [bacterium]|nr:hypothetical protein [bacterium]